ncbi:MAG: hypothetical protein HY243_18355 [Proteobacteria bacterium]|nr:hypothetical protein [Pseudomonadota bacterium]
MNRIVLLAIACALLAACAAQPRVASIPTAPPPGEISGLAGLEASQVKLAYGAPNFVRKDNGFEIWRYDGANCKAFFFLYRETSRLAVRHVETMPRGQGIAADASCLDALKARAHAIS